MNCCATDRNAVLFAFDLLELDGRELIHVPIEERKYQLARLLHECARFGGPPQRLRPRIVG